MPNLLLASVNYMDRVERGVWMEVRDPATGLILGAAIDRKDEHRPARFLLLGLDSAEAQKQIALTKERAVARYKRDGEINFNEDEEQEAAIDLLVALTRDWENIDFGEELDVPCTVANVRHVYRNIPWLRNQVSDFINQKRNYGPQAQIGPVFGEAIEKLQDLEKKQSDGSSGAAASTSGAQQAATSSTT